MFHQKIAVWIIYQLVTWMRIWIEFVRVWWFGTIVGIFLWIVDMMNQTENRIPTKTICRNQCGLNGNWFVCVCHTTLLFRGYNTEFNSWLWFQCLWEYLGSFLCIFIWYEDIICLWIIQYSALGKELINFWWSDNCRFWYEGNFDDLSNDNFVDYQLLNPVTDWSINKFFFQFVLRQIFYYDGLCYVKVQISEIFLHVLFECPNREFIGNL